MGAVIFLNVTGISSKKSSWVMTTPDRVDLRMRVKACPGGEGRKQAHKNIMPYRPVYMRSAVNNLFTAVTSSWDSSPQPVNGRRATVGPMPRRWLIAIIADTVLGR